MFEDSEERSREIEINLRWPLKPDVPYHWANQFAVTTNEQEVIIRFGRFSPLIFNQGETEIDQFLKTAEIDVLAQIVMTPEAFKKMFMMLARSATRMGISEIEEPKNDSSA